MRHYTGLKILAEIESNSHVIKLINKLLPPKILVIVYLMEKGPDNQGLFQS